MFFVFVSLIEQQPTAAAATRRLSGEVGRKPSRLFSVVDVFSCNHFGSKEATEGVKDSMEERNVTESKLRGENQLFSFLFLTLFADERVSSPPPQLQGERIVLSERDLVLIHGKRWRGVRQLRGGTEAMHQAGSNDEDELSRSCSAKELTCCLPRRDAVFCSS